MKHFQYFKIFRVHSTTRFLTPPMAAGSSMKLLFFMNSNHINCKKSLNVTTEPKNYEFNKTVEIVYKKFFFL